MKIEKEDSEESKGETRRERGMGSGGYLLGKHRHGTRLRADVGRGSHSLVVSAGYAASLENVGDEGSGEGVPGAYCVGYLHLGSGLE